MILGTNILVKELKKRRLYSVRFMIPSFYKEDESYFLYTSNLILPSNISYWEFDMNYHLSIKDVSYEFKNRARKKKDSIMCRCFRYRYYLSS